MKFRIEIWSIERLKEVYDSGKLNLNPPYQRKFIWSLKDQQTLIQSILSGYAIPNIFLFEKDTNNFDMVDGQQRSRTIFGYIDNQFEANDGLLFEQLPEQGHFSKYELPVTIIEEINERESIEEFYSLVNKSGVHLNRPELKRAEYFDTNFLKLVTELASLQNFQSLDLFSENTTRRMNDVDFVSELVTYQIEGVSDKKIKVDKVFESDISLDEYGKLVMQFESIINIFKEFDSIFPLKRTRYKQKNDFYTLFVFIDKNKNLDIVSLKYFYQLLLKFNDDINPSNDKCEPFQLYAFHCISQSNSKYAREERLNILSGIFLNKGKKPNKIQKEILKYYNLEVDSMVVVNGYLNISAD